MVIVQIELKSSKKDCLFCEHQQMLTISSCLLFMTQDIFYMFLHIMIFTVLMLIVYHYTL